MVKFKKYLKKIILFLIYLNDKVIPKNKNQIIYNSFPDFSDNSFALFVYIAKNYKNFKHIWLVDDIKNIYFYQKMEKTYIGKNISKIVKKRSFKGLYYYLTSKYVFFTHGLFTPIKVPKNHVIINLWHGMPPKKVSFLDNKSPDEVPKFTYCIATSKFYQDILSKAFGVNKSNVWIIGQPRNDFLLKNDMNILKRLNIKKYNKKIIWLPTYRNSIIGDIRIDGKFKEGFPVLNLKDLDEINEILKNDNSVLIIKIHPMDYLIKKTFKNYSNIKILKNEDLLKKGIQLYSLLSVTDALLTDYSSVFIDYLLTNKPIGFVFDDIDEFNKSRGFIFDNPLDYLPGKIITNKKKFIEFIKNPQKAENYNKILNKFNEVKEKSCEKLWKHLIVIR